MPLHDVSGVVLRQHAAWVLLEAALDPEHFSEVVDLWGAERAGGRWLTFQPAEGEQLTAFVRFSSGPHPRTIALEAETASAELAAKLASILDAYSASSDGSTFRDQRSIEERVLRDQQALDRALVAAALPSLAEDRRGRRIDEATARILMGVYAANPSFRARERVLLALQAPRTTRPVKHVLSTWLLEQFPRFASRRHRGAIGCALLDLAGPEEIDRLAALAGDQGLGSSRGILLEVIAATGAESAPRVLANLLDGPLVIGVLRALSVLGKKASGEGPTVSTLLTDGRAEVRQHARRALRRMGLDPEPPTAPPHVLAGPAARFASANHWSTSLDLADLSEFLGLVRSVIGRGRGADEEAAIVRAGETMEVGETRSFVLAGMEDSRNTDVQVTLHLDDLDTVDVHLQGQGGFVERLGEAWDSSRFASN